MTSQRQLEANRANAKRSTGPKTPQGKARSRRNSYKHGLRTRISPRVGGGFHTFMSDSPLAPVSLLITNQVLLISQPPACMAAKS